MSGRLLSQIGRHCKKKAKKKKQTLDFFRFLRPGQVFISTFWGSLQKSLSRRFDGGAEEPRTAHQKTALQDSWCLQHLASGAESSCRDLCLRVRAGLGKVRRWTLSGELSSGCPHFLADDIGSAGLQRNGSGGAVAASSSSAWQHGRARGACNVAVLKRDDFVCGTLHGGFAVMERSSVLWEDGGQRAPGWVCQGRRVSECDNRQTLSSLSDLASSFVPHARLFSLHPSLVSENECSAHGVGGMNSRGSVHGAVVHDNSFGLHVNSRGALGHRNSCNSCAAELREERSLEYEYSVQGWASC